MASGLITKNTDLKSLKYSSMPFGGDKPYVTKDIGQAPSNQVGLEISHRIDDVSRIAQMLVGKPGIKYLLHEAELQQIGVGQRIKKAQQGGKSLAGAVLQQVGSTLLTTAKIVGSTLAQVPVNGTGTHFLKGFRTDTYLQPSGPGNISAFASFFGAGGVEGAQYALRGEIVPGEHKTELSSKTSDLSPYSTTEDKVATNTTKGFNNVNYDNSPYTNKAVPKTKVLGSIDKTGISGSGLPDSYENVGKTYTSGSTFTGTDTKKNIGAILASGSSTLAVGTNTGKYNHIHGIPNTITGSATQNPNFDKAAVDYTDTATYSQEQAKRVIGNTTKRTQKETRVGLGDQGKTAKANVNYWTPAKPLEIDKLNALDISNTRQDGAAEARDLAKFYFEIITPEGSKFLYFRAHIKSIDDSFNADWQAHKYVGRAENFYTYGGFDRDVNVSFTIAAATRTEMRPLYRKMVYLASSTAPTYGVSGLMRGTLARLTVGSYLDQIPGVITSVKFTVDNNVPWEIAMGQPEGVENDVQVLPMVMECSVAFKPIHDFAPQTGLHHFFTNSHKGPKFFEPGETIK